MIGRDEGGDGSAVPRGGPGQITIEGLVKRYGRLTAVDHLSFTALPGRVTGFVGPNGAGKSTTLQILTGLMRQDAGSALVAGVPYCDLTSPASTIGVVFEENTFHPGRTARTHLQVLAARSGSSNHRVDEVLGTVALDEVASQRIGRLSMGMRQRLGLAAALLGKPYILVLDEPANGLDPHGIRWLRTFLREFAGGGGTVLVSSHILSELAQLADDVVVIDQGKLVKAAPIEKLRTEQRHRVLLRHATALEAALRDEGLVATRVDNRTLSIASQELDTLLGIAVKNHLSIEAIEPEGANLEDTFLALTGGEARPS